MLEEGKTRMLVPVSGEADVPGRISHNSDNFSDHTVGGPGAEIIMGQLGARPHPDQVFRVFHTPSLFKANPIGTLKMDVEWGWQDCSSFHCGHTVSLLSAFTLSCPSSWITENGGGGETV